MKSLTIVPLLVCKCGEIMLKSDSGVRKLRARILLFRDQKSFGVCKGCGGEIEVPVSIGEVPVQVPAPHNPRLYVLPRTPSTKKSVPH